MPRIGLLSDSHGRGSTTRRAVEVLSGHGIDLMIHLGDVGSVEVIDALLVPMEPTERNDDHRAGDGGQLPTYLVFGNTDGDAPALGDYARELGITVAHPVGRLSLDGDGWDDGPSRGDVLVFCHGHQRPPMDRAIADRARYLCHGHTHLPSDTRKNATRIINPGALFRARRYTVAILDIEADDLTFLAVNES